MIKIPMLVRRVRVEKLPTKDRNVRVCVRLCLCVHVQPAVSVNLSL